MSKINPAKREAAEDVFFGQIAIIWARWLLIAAGAIIALWSAESVGQLAIAVVTVVLFMAINFFIHGRYLVERPANRLLLLITGLLDIAAITALVTLWPGQTGLVSDFFILYYPLLFAFALVFSPRVAVTFGLLTLGLYAIACLVSSDPAAMFSIGGFKILVTRLITLGAMSGLGAFYYRRQRDSLRAMTAKMSPLLK